MLSAAVVGAGPSGFYAAQALLKSGDPEFRVDLLDRLPTPYGLVRSGVAPDHAKIKGVTKVFERTADLPRFRFFGNVRLGADVQVADLRRHYQVIVYACGAERARSLGIPGEDLRGVHSAAELVGWYNGHPDYRDREFDLSCRRAAVVGIGNVALDVTRILSKAPDSLAATDIAGHALSALRRSRLQEVFVLGRRGPAQAAFSPKEFRDISEDPAIDLLVTAEDMELDPVSKESLATDAGANARQNVDYLMRELEKGEEEQERKVRLRLKVSPVEFLGEEGRLKAVRLERNELYRADDGRIRPRGTGKFEVLPVGIVFRSVGYRGVPIPGVPFDQRRGKISNVDGRVAEPESGGIVRGEYVVGWAKRGPSGLIGTNRACSVATVERILQDIRDGKLAVKDDWTPEGAEAMLRAKQPECVTFEDWRVLDRLEMENGKKVGKSRDKFTSIEDMLAALSAEK